jgi:chaperonin GroES
MKVRPLNDRVLIKRIEAKEKAKGGIIIPDTAKEKPMEGKVISVGAGKLDDNGKRIALEVKVGNKVLFGKYAGTEIKMPAPRSRSTTKSTSSCARTRSSASSTNQEELVPCQPSASPTQKTAARRSSAASTSSPTP